MNEYMVIYVDYKTDKSKARYVLASSEKEAIRKVKLLVNYWRIVDVILVKENVQW